jgi:hypothetical protein
MDSQTMEHLIPAQGEKVIGFDFERRVIIIDTGRIEHRDGITKGLRVLRIENLPFLDVERLLEHWRYIVLNPRSPMGKWGKLA